MFEGVFMFKRLFSILSLSALVGVSLSTIPSQAATNFPKRIISLSPSATEDLFAIGAGKQVIAVDDYSTYPTSAPRTKLSGFSPNLESIVKYKPDLVVIQSTAAKAMEIVKQLQLLKVPTYVEHTPNNLNGAFSEILELGKLTNQQNKAERLIQSMKKSIAGSLKTSKASTKLSIYHELDKNLYSATSTTFIGQVYKSFGLTNIADAASKADDGGYPQLQSEYVVKADPNIIFLADAPDGESIETVAARPGWQKLSAVSKSKVVVLPSDIPSRWGPRIADFYSFVSKTITSYQK
jgi:iron complex transport system substrate-binding protein